MVSSSSLRLKSSEANKALSKHQDAQKEGGIYLSPDVNYGLLPSLIDRILSEKLESLRQHNQRLQTNSMDVHVSCGH